MKHDTDSAIRSLSRKRDVRINPSKKIIKILSNDAPRKTNDIGNGSWGRIDYLIHQQGFSLIKVNKHAKK